jgi:adenylate cyclase class 2
VYRRLLRLAPVRDVSKGMPNSQAPPERTETEVKIPIGDPRPIVRNLAAAGFRRKHPRTFERNVVFDTPEQNLRNAGSLLRLRQFGKRWVLTFKGPALEARHKSREELEVRVAEGETLAEILSRIGFEPLFWYEKYRTEFSDGQGIGTVDETPIGNYMELEGAPEWIDATALKLGFSAADYVTKSYGRLYLEYCERNGLQPSNMTF